MNMHVKSWLTKVEKVIFFQLQFEIFYNEWIRTNSFKKKKKKHIKKIVPNRTVLKDETKNLVWPKNFQRLIMKII